jgi:Tol biopolymer transport system component
MTPFIVGPANETDPAVSPNGRWLAYQSDESGRRQVYVRPIPGPGARVPVSVDGGGSARWSVDGATIFFRGPTHVMAATVVERPQLAVTRRDTLFADKYSQAASTGTAFDVFPNGREFLMLKGNSVKPQLFVVVNWPQLIGKSAATAGGR